MDRLDAMQTFVRVAEAGSFIAVANQLQVARSVVTRQIAALEKYLGSKLITRSTRSLTLTAAGSAYLEKCRVILNMVDAAESTLAEEKAEPRGRIRLGLPLTYGLQELTPKLLEFASQYPFVELALDFSDQRANLIEEGLDLSIRITADLQPGDIVRKLGETRLLTIAAPSYLKRHGEPRDPGDLKHHECLVYARENPVSNWVYQKGGRSFQVSVRGRLVANNGVALAEAAARGMGIARQPEFIGAPYIAQKLVKVILKDFEDAPLGIYAVLPSNRYVPHRVSVLIEYLSKLFTRTSRASAGSVKNIA
jgi:DNA-binding transcriptional LysR family regulator